MDGLLLIDKPVGWTSFDVVNYVRSIVRRVVCSEHEGRGFCMAMQNKEDVTSADNRTKEYGDRATQQPDAAMRVKSSSANSLSARQGWRCKCRVKVGHTGTLDPAATGLLVLCVGKYTKKVSELIRHDKTYEAEITFGATSTSGDVEGEIRDYTESGNELVEPKISDVKSVLKKFLGEIEQIPPKYSALKIDGKRAYELARLGKEVNLKPRKVMIYSIDLQNYAWPKAKITCKVGSGTYIRTLAEDIGKSLGVGAYLSGLRRTSVDTWSVEDAVEPKSITIDNIAHRLVA